MNKCAVFTIVRDEAVILPVWLRYYSQYFSIEDMYVLDNDSKDGSTNNITQANVRIVHNEKYFDHAWLLKTVQDFQRQLFSEGYEYVLFTEADEIILINPDNGHDLGAFIKNADKPTYRCTGFEIWQNTAFERPIDWTVNVMNQRRFWRGSPGFSKPLLSKVPLTWGAGFHTCDNMPEPDPNLILCHLHWADMKTTLAKHEYKRKQDFEKNGLEQGLGFHHRWSEDKLIADYVEAINHLIEIPGKYRSVKI